MRSSALGNRHLAVGAGPELGQAAAPSFIGVVIALHLVRKGSELPRLDVRIELDVDAALPLAVVPGLAWRALLHAGWRAEQGAQVALALADETYGLIR